jgi:hypothetical protein
MERDMKVNFYNQQQSHSEGNEFANYNGGAASPHFREEKVSRLHSQKSNINGFMKTSTKFNSLWGKTLALWCLVIFMCTAKNTFSQSFSVVGTGTGANTSLSYPAPFGNYYWGSRHQFFLTAAELSAAGITSGSSINSVGFNVTATNGAAAHTNYQIIVYNVGTNANPLSAGYVTATQVASSTAANVTPTLGWVQTNLASAFTWNGTDNLVIQVCHNNTSFNTNASTQWTTTLTGTSIKSRYRYADASGQCTNTATIATSTTTRPNIRFGWSAPGACAIPGAISTSAVTATSATISWGAASPAPTSGYQWEVRTSGAAGSGAVGLAASGSTGAGITTASVTGLTGLTTYSIYVRSNCGAGGFSSWTAATTFVTACGGVTCNYTLRLTDSFGDGWNGATMQVRVGTSVVTTVGSTFTTGTQLNIPVSLCTTGGYNLFYSAGGAYPTEVGIQILDPSNTVIYTLGAGAGTVGTQLTTFTASCPTCFVPGVPTASAITGTTATISWTAASPAPSNGYQWEVRTSGAAGSGATGLAASGTTGAGILTANVTGLTQLTGYSVYVRSNCGAGGFSNWTAAGTFVTACGAISCNYILRLTDSFGDGWNGATMQVRFGTTVIATVGSTFTTGTQLDIPVNLCNTGGYNLFYSAGGTYPGEVGIQIIRPDGTTQYTLGAGLGTVGTQLTSFTAACPTCFPPTGVTLSNLTSTGTTISWTAPTQGSPSSYQWKIVAAGAGSGGAAVASGTVTAPTVTANATGLVQSTSYDVWVRTDCGGGDLSAWTGPLNFITPCPSFPLPFSEGFNGTTLPCWTQVVTTASLFGTPALTASLATTSSFPTGLSPFEGARMVQFNSYDSWNGAARLMSPPIVTTGSPYIQVQFRWFQDAYSTGAENVQVQYSTNGTTWVNAGSTIPRYNASFATPTWTTQTIQLPAAAGNQPTLYVGFLVTSAWAANTYLDLVEVTSVACPAPTSPTASAITGTSATISWTAGLSNPASYDIVFGVSPLAVPNAGTTPTHTSSTTSRNMTGLTGATTYQYYVRSACGGGNGNSSWAGPFSFTTPVSNDLVQNAIPIVCATPINGTTDPAFGATNDNVTNQCSSGQMASPNAQPGPGVWYKITGDNQEYTLSLCNAISYDSRISVYTGPATAPTIASLTCVTGNDDDPSCPFTSGFPSKVTFTAFSGSTYYILVHGYSAFSYGSFVLSSSCAPGCITSTPNDNCTAAQSLTVQPYGAGTYQNTWNTCATPDMTLANPTFENSFATLFDSWYSFNSGQYPQLSLFIDNTGVAAPPMTDLRYQLYTGTCAAPVQSGTVNAAVNINGTVNTITGLTASTNYLLRVYTLNSATRGNFRIKLETPVAPANDNCSGAIVLAQQNGTTCTTPTGGTTQWATQSLTGNGSCAPAVAGSSDDDVWYTFTALSSNPTITVTGTAGFQPAAEIRSATCAGGSAISCSAASAANGTATITTSGLTIGNTYFVRVYSVGTTIATMGTFNICVFGNIPTVTNDGICNATVINVNDVASFGTYTNIGAITNTLGNTGSSCFTAAQMNADVWFRANIPTTQANRTLVLNFQSVTGAYGDYNVQVFTSADNTCVTGLTEIACNDAGGPGSMPFVYVDMPAGKDVAYIRVTANATGQYSVFQMAATTGVNWTGATSGAWNLNTNWLCTDNIPAVTNNVVIPSGTTNALNFATAQTCNDIKLMPGANITVGTGGTLTVNGQWIASVTGNTSSGAGRVIMSGTGTQIQGVTTFSNLEVTNNRSIAGQSNNRVDINGELRLTSGVLTTSGNLNLKSTAANTAGFINDFGTNTGLISGGVTVERYINHANYSYLGSPINNASILPWGNIIGGFSANGADGANIIMDPTCSFLQAGTPYSRIMQLNESEITAACLYSGWEVRYSGTLTNGRGYSVLVPAVGTTIRTTGNHNTGTITLPVTKQGTGSFSGVNLVSNPYPSSIDLGAFKAANAGISAIGYTFNGNTSNALSLTAGNFVGSHQGFQVVASTNSTLTFNNSMRVTNSATFYETPAATLTITATSGQGLQDYTQINIGSANATDGYDFDYDGLKFASQNGYPTLFTNIDNQSAMFAINSFPTNLATKVIPMGFMAGTDGTFTLDFQGLDNLPATVMLVLEDKLTGQKKVLNPGVTYTFSSSVSDASDRFNLLLYPQISIVVNDAGCNKPGNVVFSNNSDVDWNFTLYNANQSILQTGHFTGTSPQINLPKGEYTVKISTTQGQSSYVYNTSTTVVGPVSVSGQVVLSGQYAVVGEDFIVDFSNLITDNPTLPAIADISFGDGNSTVVSLDKQTMSYQYTVPGTYQFKLIAGGDQSPCKYTYESYVVVSDVNTSVDNMVETGTISMFANENVLTINFPEALSGRTKVSIYDLAGKLVFNKQMTDVPSGQQQFVIHNVVKGIYIVKLEGNDVQMSKKILLNN